MSSTVIREIFTRWGFKADTGAVKKFDKAIGAAKKGAALAGKAMIGMGAAAAVAGAGIFALVKGQAEAADKIAKDSRKLDVSAGTLQRLALAAQFSGTHIDKLIPGIKKLSVVAYDASQGSKTAVDSLKELGIETVDVNGNLKDTEVLLRESLYALSSVENSTLKVALAQKVFGRSGVELLPLLEGGAIGLAAMFREADDLGIVLSGKALSGAEGFIDSLLRFEESIRGVAMQFSAELFPVFDRYLKIAKDWIVANKKLIQGKLEKWIKATIKAIEGVDLDAVIVGLKVMATQLGVIVRAAALAAQGLLGIVGVLMTLGKWIGETAAQAYLWYEAYVEATDKMDAAIRAFVGRVFDWFAAMPDHIIRGLGGAGPAIADFFGGIFDWIALIPGRLVDAFVDGITSAAAWLKPNLRAFGEWTKSDAARAATAGPARAGASSVSNSTRNVNITAPMSVQMAAGTSPVEARRLGSAAAAGAATYWRTAAADLER
jgi:hypothetical protein